MRKGAILTFALSGALFLAMTATAQPPGGGGKGDKGGFGGKGGGAGGFGMRSQPGQILPQFIQESLKLTDDQKKQLDDLQKDVDAKLDKMLTVDQKTELKAMRERGPGGQGGGKGGGKGGPGGGKGGPGGPGGGKGGGPKD